MADAVRLVDAAGTVEVQRRTGAPWERATPGMVLVPGDRVRTGTGSRATFQFSDRSVFRLNQSSVLEIRPSNATNGRRSLFLRTGEMFFLDRERPARLEIETPTSTSAIRGTEFVLGAEGPEGATRLTLLEGSVLLAAGGAEMEVRGGEMASVAPGGVPQARPLLEARSAVQWCLYYPGVIVPSDLELTPDEAVRLADSLGAYGRGDMRAALAALPGEGLGSQDAQGYAAGLRLAVGQTADVDRLRGVGMGAGGAAVRALGVLVAAARGEVLESEPDPLAPTASEALAASYYWQSRSEIRKALQAAERAVALAPGSGYAWVRRAELEWAEGRRRAAMASLERGREASPGNPMAAVVAGFIELERGRVTVAREHFERAREMDGGLAEIWLGLGLVAERVGDGEEALRAMQLAAATEPGRAVVRSYLGKAWSASGAASLADTEFERALELDPNDPTTWFYRGLHRQQNHRLNESVDDLQESVVRNDGRSVFRSSLGLDRDRAMRRADLSIGYSALGLDEWAARTASRALADDYTDYSAHLFRARTIQRQLEDASGLETRHEAARQSHLLVANLLAPPEGAHLSQHLSQQEHLRPFEGGALHGSSLTEYRSSGDFAETASLFGTVGRLGYALDGRYLTMQGDRPNATREEGLMSLQAKQAVGDRDEFYLQAGWQQRKGDDLARLYDPNTSIPGLRFDEEERPSAYLGWHREWHPASHTLALASVIDARQHLLNPAPQILYLRERGGAPVDLSTRPYMNLDLLSRFRLVSVELQQIWQTERHAIVAGVRYQSGDYDVEQTLSQPGTTVLSLDGDLPGMIGAGGYAYYTFAPVRSLRITGGLAYDDLRHPANATWPPLGTDAARERQWSPKVGIRWEPWSGGFVRAAYTRSLGASEFAQSVRLEPVEVGSFTQVFRNLAPASVTGLLTGLPQEVAGLGVDQTFPSRTFAGLTFERVATDGRRELGVARNTRPVPTVDAVGTLAQELEYREHTASIYVGQLLGRWWSAGLRYSLAEAELETAFPTLPVGLPGARGLSEDSRSVLGQLRLHAGFHHESGFFAQWASEFLHQAGGGDAARLSDEAVWQHDVWVGYRFPRRRAEVRLGVINLTDQDYRLNPLNDFRPRWRERTFEAAVRIQF